MPQEHESLEAAHIATEEQTESQEKSVRPAKKYKGSLEVVCGSMFSGKTEELMRRLKRAEYAKKNVLTIKHYIDNRAHHQYIVSHDGQERIAFPVDDSDEGIDKIHTLASPEVDVIGIDEIQFFPHKIIHVLRKLVEEGKRVIVAGLDLDFRGEPFGIMPILLSIADSITKLQAICMSCGKDSHFSQRIINGVPANYEDPIVLVGAAESYEARCRDCFTINKLPGYQLKLDH